MYKGALAVSWFTPFTRLPDIANMFIRSALLLLSVLAAAKEMPKDEIKAAQLYDTGIRHMNNVALKKARFDSKRFVLRLKADIQARNTGPFRKLLVYTPQLSTPRSKRKSRV